MRTALLLPLLALLVSGQESVILEGELLEGMRDLGKRLAKVQKKEMNPDDFLKLYSKVRASPAREAAKDAYYYGLALDKLHRPEEARIQFARATKLFEAFPPAWLALSDLARQAGARSEAMNLVQKALNLDPNYGAAWFHIGGLYELDNRRVESFAALEKALGLQPNPLFCRAVAQSALSLREASYSDTERKAYADKALRAATSCTYLVPDDGNAHLLLAEVHRILGDEAAMKKTLEAALNTKITDESKLHCLERLLRQHGVEGDLEAVGRTLDRILAPALEKVVTGKERERYEQMRKDLREHGADATGKWVVEALLEAFENESLPVDVRRRALHQIAKLYLEGFDLAKPALLELHRNVFGRLITSVTVAPAPLMTEMLSILREMHRNPRLISIVVFFVYPYDDERRTPDVRIEGIRTLTTVAPKACLPVLFYCLKDDAPEVLRAVDRALVEVTQRRSPIGEGSAPVTEAEKKTMRKEWTDFLHSAEGGRLLAESFRALAECVPMRQADTRDMKQAPLATHAALIAADGDVSWEGWLASHQFLTGYLGKEFRPVERRDRPVEPSERAAIAAEVEKFWSGK